MAAEQELSLSLRKFDMKMIPQDATCVFIGRRRTGKSTLLKDLLYYHQDIPMGTVISGTEESNSFFGKMIPPAFIHNDYNPIILSNFVKSQRSVMARIKKETDAGMKSRIDPRAFLILDDCMYDDSWTRDVNIRYLFMNGRHIKTFFMITMQYPLGVPPVLRTNIDFVFILREPSPQNRRRIFENYGSAFPTFEFFCQVMDQCTNNYECIVINNAIQSNKLVDSIYWYKADMHGDFRIGAPEFWAAGGAGGRGGGAGGGGAGGPPDMSAYNGQNASRLRGPVIQVRKTA
jgi:hypothetical protein